MAPSRVDNAEILPFQGEFKFRREFKGTLRVDDTAGTFRLNDAEVVAGFEPFPRLPTELRLKIWYVISVIRRPKTKGGTPENVGSYTGAILQWLILTILRRLAFSQPRFVNITGHRRVGKKNYRGKGTQGRLPATLHVNQESRNETIRYHCIRSNPHPCEVMALCFNPTVDHIFMHISNFAGHPKLPSWVKKWLKSEGKNGKESLAAVETLHIWADEHAVTYLSDMQSRSKTRGAWCVFKYFVGLKKIIITGFLLPGDIIHQRDLRHFLQSKWDQFYQHKYDLQDRKMPEVIFL